jgi:ABC-type glycerol-3-phosphate transport system substrate-binding protein
MGGKHTSRRDFLKVAAGTVGAGLLATTGLEEGVKTAAAAPTAVRARAIEPTGTMWGLNYKPHVDSYHRMADLFKKQTGSTITVYPQPYGYTNEIAAIAAGTQPDLVVQNGQLISALALQGALVEIRKSVYTYNHITVTKDPTTGLLISPSFTGDAIQPFSLGDSIYGVPLEADGGLGGIVNIPQDQVDKLGLTKDYPPGNGKLYFDDYNQLYALAKALQVVKNGKVVKWGLSGEGWDLPTLGGEMLTMGVSPFDSVKEQFNFNTPAGIQAMQYHVEMPYKLGIEREWNVTDAVISQALNGNVAVTMANGDVAIEGNTLYGLHYVIVGMPKINGKTPRVFGEGQGWGVVGPIKPQHPNLQTAFLRMMATAAGQYQYDLTYGGVAVVAWKDFLLHDTSRFHPANKTNNEYLVGTAAWFQNAMLNCQYIGRAGYTDKIDAAVYTGCQGVREGKLTSAQAMARIQQTCVAQYKQYKADLANL